MYRLDKHKLKLLKQKAIYAIRVEDDGVAWAFSSFCDKSVSSMVFHTKNGQCLTVTHGRDDGMLCTDFSLANKTDILLSCYPRRVIFRYPGLRDKYPSELRFIDTPLCVSVYWGWLFVTVDDPKTWPEWNQ